MAKPPAVVTGLAEASGAGVFMQELQLTDKHRPADGPVPKLSDYETSYRDFSWSAVAERLTGVDEPELLNITDVVLDRALREARGTEVAIRWLAADRRSHLDLNYRRLADLSRQFAGVLNFLEVPPESVVCTALGRVPELYVAAFGIIRRGGIFCPMFSAFGPEPLRMRLEQSKAQVLLTTHHIYERKIKPIRGRLPDLRWIILTDVYEVGELADDCVSYAHMMERAPPFDGVAPTRPEDPALLHFTSGTTGTPKGALHVHRAVLVHHATSELVLDLRPSDRFWCTADPGWVTGTSYGIIGPLSIGVTMIVDEAEFDAALWYQTLQDQEVDVWYTAPTALRMLIRAGDELPQRYDLSKLRHAVCVGEPLTPEAVIWSARILRRPVHDTWWQTETGGIMLANYASMPIKAGSMGRPVPGVSAAIVRRQGDQISVCTQPGEVGELALRADWPSLFTAYLGQPERYKHCFAGGYYLSGDLASCDADDYFWFVGRADDVIKSAGHLIGPFEVESALLEHPAVAEAAVIGKPDELLLAVVKAFIVLRSGYEPTADTTADIMAFSRKRLGAAVAPREVAFVSDLPKTKSGKIMRRLLLAREQGLPEGDTSTLETALSTTNVAGVESSYASVQLRSY